MDADIRGIKDRKIKLMLASSPKHYLIVDRFPYVPIQVVGHKIESLEKRTKIDKKNMIFKDIRGKFYKIKNGEAVEL